MWYYDSPIGRMEIFQNPQDGRFYLKVRGETHGSYPSAVAAANNVYCFVTGCYDWDRLDCQIDDVPTDIYEWTQG